MKPEIAQHLRILRDVGWEERADAIESYILDLEKEKVAMLQVIGTTAGSVLEKLRAELCATKL